MTEREKVIDTILRHKEEITKLGVERLGIFGSTARGDSGPDSDVDIVVLFNEQAQSGAYFELYLGLQSLLQNILGKRVDVVTEAGIKPRIRPYIEKDLVNVIA